MSAECSECGSDLVGFLETLECPVCVKDEKIAALLADLHKAVAAAYFSLGILERLHGGGTVTPESYYAARDALRLVAGINPPQTA